MKLTRGKLLETIRRKNQGWTTYQTRKIAGISIRRVNQVYTQYLLTGQIPEIGKTNGRPPRPIEEWEVETVKEAFCKYSVSASMLMKLIERDYGKHINHNRIHRILLSLGMAKKKDKKDVRKKDWIRYERRHSLTAVHIDWYYFAPWELWVFAVIDDASRKLLALVECKNPTTDASIEGMGHAMKHGTILQCISDHGSQFTSNIGGDSQFKEFLDNNGIQQILCRIKHPQSNGKVEKFFDLYKNKRSLFNLKEEFIEWYNEIRPHSSLNFQILETPQQAFIRKLRAEV
jgi:putative transposase